MNTEQAIEHLRNDLQWRADNTGTPPSMLQKHLDAINTLVQEVNQLRDENEGMQLAFSNEHQLIGKLGNWCTLHDVPPQYVEHFTKELLAEAARIYVASGSRGGELERQRCMLLATFNSVKPAASSVKRP